MWLVGLGWKADTVKGKMETNLLESETSCYSSWRGLQERKPQETGGTVQLQNNQSKGGDKTHQKAGTAILPRLLRIKQKSHQKR